LHLEFKKRNKVKSFDLKHQHKNSDKHDRKFSIQSNKSMYS